MMGIQEDMRIKRIIGGGFIIESDAGMKYIKDILELKRAIEEYYKDE